MTQISEFLRQEESETLEFKEAFGKEAIETIAAFANTRGGALLVGINDKGVAIGVPSTKNALKDWANHISQATGGLHPSIEAGSVKGKNVVVIQVEEHRIKPVMCHGRAFIRSGSTTRQMTLEEITRCVLANAGVTWDALPEPRASLSDISMPKFKAFMDTAKQEKRRSIPAGTSHVELLEKLELVIKGKPTRAAILLFGKEPQRFYSQAMLKIGRFRNETLMVDDRRIDGTLSDQIEGAIGYFREKLDTRYVMTGRPQREVVWEYPLKALREAVTNAICHRDYMSTRDTEVRIYDTELMVWNAGNLPPGISLDTLKLNHPSVPRNKKIAEILYYAGVIEAWGGGTKLIMAECALAEMPEPVFDQEIGFRVTFRKAPQPDTRKVADKYPTSTRQVSDKHSLVDFCATPRSIKEMLDFLELKNRENFMHKHLNPLIKKGFLALTDPDSPNSPRQRYITTKKGRSVA
jgi:ATP-dependent DNA helicase RecG